MKIVLDTNVLVSGLLSPFGPNGEILRMISAGAIVLCLDARILSEYKEVLLRPKFQFNPEHVEILIDFIKQAGLFVAGVPLMKTLPDPDDEPFLEAAIAGSADCIVTGNIAHFPPASREGIPVLSPSKFIEFYRSKRAGK